MRASYLIYSKYGCDYSSETSVARRYVPQDIILQIHLYLRMTLWTHIPLISTVVHGVGSAFCGTRRHASLPMTTNRTTAERRSDRASIKRAVVCQTWRESQSPPSYLALQSSFTWAIRCWRRDSEGSRIPRNSFTVDKLRSRALNDSFLPTFSLFACCVLLCLHFL
jgi:hypothetical protein